MITDPGDIDLLLHVKSTHFAAARIGMRGLKNRRSPFSALSTFEKHYL